MKTSEPTTPPCASSGTPMKDFGSSSCNARRASSLWAIASRYPGVTSRISDCFVERTADPTYRREASIFAFSSVRQAAALAGSRWTTTRSCSWPSSSRVSIEQPSASSAATCRATISTVSRSSIVDTSADPSSARNFWVGLGDAQLAFQPLALADVAHQALPSTVREDLPADLGGHEASVLPPQRPLHHQGLAAEHRLSHLCQPIQLLGQDHVGDRPGQRPPRASSRASGNRRC